MNDSGSGSCYRDFSQQAQPSLKVHPMKTMAYSFMVHSVCAFLLLAQSAAFGTETVGLYNATSSQFYLKNRHAGGSAAVSFAFGPRRSHWLPLRGCEKIASPRGET
jgi:hypothetical protein